MKGIYQGAHPMATCGSILLGLLVVSSNWGPAYLAQENVPIVIQPDVVFVVVTDAEAVEIIDASGKLRKVEVNTESGNEVSFVKVYSGESIKAIEKNKCDLYLPMTGSLHMSQGTVVRVPEKEAGKAAEEKHTLELLKGKLFIQIEHPEKSAAENQQFRIKTPTSILAVKGTKFFVEVTEAFDNIGVNEGNVVVKELETGAAADLKAGFAASVRKGQVSPVRRLTREEAEYDSYYESRGPNAIAGEKRRRIYKATYGIQERASSQPRVHPDKISVEEGEDDSMPGGFLRFTMKPYEGPAFSASGNVEIGLNVDLPAEPIGLSFYVRSHGIKKPRFSITFPFEDVLFRNPGLSYFPQLEQKLDGTEWTPVVIPVCSTSDPIDEKLRILYLDMTMGGGLKQMINGVPVPTLVEGRETYSIDISRISVLVRKKEP